MDIKFEFTLDFQFDLIRFTLKDKRGLKVLKLYTPNNFIDTNHAILINVIKGYVKKKKKPPSETLFREELNDWFKSKESEDLNEDDRKELYKLLKELYDKPLIDSDEIYEKASQFAAYIKVKEEIDNFNLYSFKDYEPFANKVLKAIKIGNDLKEEKGTYLISDIHTRQFNRQDINPIVPTPFRQINKLTNAGGYDKGSIVNSDDYDKDKPELYVDYILDFLLGENKIKDGSKFGIYELMPYYEKVNIKNYIIGFGYQEKTSLSFDQIIRLRTNFVKEIVKYTNYTPIEDDIKIHFNHYLD